MFANVPDICLKNEEKITKPYRLWDSLFDILIPGFFLKSIPNHLLFCDYSIFVGKQICELRYQQKFAQFIDFTVY